MFVPLIVQLGTDASSICRRGAGETIAALLSCISEEKANIFLTWLQKWFIEEQSMTLKRLSVQVFNVALGNLAEDGNKYDQKHLAANSFCIRNSKFQ